jgi:nitrate ABC transporter ATP-binding subunit
MSARISISTESPPPSAVYLDISRIDKTFPTPRGPLTVVKDFDLKVQRGEFVTLLGHSGCGKSTVLAMLAGLESPSRGGIVLAGKEVDGPGPDRGVVFQSPSLLPWMTAFNNVMLGVQRVFPHATEEQRRAIVTHYLQRVGLGHALDKKPGDLSQGMRQRVGIARAFALAPRMLLLDEPFGMLDQLTRWELQGVLLELWEKQHITTVMVTHDVDEALYLSDRVVLMTNGPEACVGEIIPVDFPRPRDRQTLLDDPHYYHLRDRLLDFLDRCERQKEAKLPSTKPATTTVSSRRSRLAV